MGFLDLFMGRLKIVKFVNFVLDDELIFILYFFILGFSRQPGVLSCIGYA